MLSRRNILAATSAAAATVGTQQAKAAKSTVDVKSDPFDQTETQKEFHAARFATLDQESLMSFAEGFKKWNATDLAGRDGRRSTNNFLRSRGLPIGESDLGYEESFNVLLEDPSYAAKTRLERSAQALMWDRSMRAFHGDADKYLTLMEETDNAGPGSLELNPDMELPDYTIHEIHAQPGGYVGDPFAGWVYHWALTQAFYQGRNEYDQVHLSIAQGCPKPADGKVLRILDMGCASGLSTTAFKERFPNAEVWGIDVGGPLVRYAHHRAVKKDIDVHFAQRLAEDTKFPDGYFDIVSDYIMFHEVTAEAAKEIVSETYRILRPGGVFNHVDIITEGSSAGSVPRTIREKAASWNIHRHNIEPWWHEFTHTNFPELLSNTGFDVDLTLRNAKGIPPVIGIKPV
jgi:ubiquinone/menaquinone biosynthesis C-methylase UbiE